MQEGLIEDEAIFIDGTKIEANANRFTFVWRKSIEKYSAALIEKSNQMYDELLEKEIIPGIERESLEELSDAELLKVAEQLDEKIAAFDQEISTTEAGSERKQLRSQRKMPKQYHKLILDMAKRKQKYQRDMVIFGERNSYSKTDYDATFMRMKEDYMKNGQLKAGYNVQVATEGQYALAYDIFPNPTDTRTLIPFLDTIEEKFFSLPEYTVADAGYGSEQNYGDILDNRASTPLITYNTYRKEKQKKYRNNPFNSSNWEYDEKEDAFMCPNGQKLPFRYVSNRKDSYGFTRTFKVYECVDCSNCPLREQCTKAKEGNNRTIRYNEKWEQQKKIIKDLLSDEKIGAIYGKRKIDVEPVFGFLKANLCFTRFSVRGKEKVHNDLGFALMAVNMRKYTAHEALLGRGTAPQSSKKGSNHHNLVIGTFFHSFQLVMSQPLFVLWLLGGCRPPGVDVGGAAAPVRSACAGASVDKRVRQLRRGPAPRRRASCPAPSSGQHSFIGGGLLPQTPTTASEPFAGGTGASPCPPVRTGFAGAGGP